MFLMNKNKFQNLDKAMDFQIRSTLIVKKLQTDGADILEQQVKKPYKNNLNHQFLLLDSIHSEQKYRKILF